LNWLVNLALLWFVLMLCMAVLELGVRILRPQKMSWLRHYKEDPVLHFVNLPNLSLETDFGEARWTIYTDENGFRVGKNRLIKRGLPAVLWLGDSFAFGNGVDYERSFIGLLNAEKPERYYFVNTGVGGWGPIQYRQQLEMLLNKGMRPVEIFVATFVGNDFHDCVYDKTMTVRDGVLHVDAAGLRSEIKRHSHLYRILSNYYHRHAKVPTNFAQNQFEMAQPLKWESGVLKEGRKKFREQFEKIARVARERSIPLTVVIIPSKWTVDATAGQRFTPSADVQSFDPMLPIQITKTIFGELGVHYIDLTEALAVEPSDNTYYRFDEHWTPLGHQIVERAILRARPDLASW